MQIPSSFYTSVYSQGQRSDSHTPSIHSSLALSVYCFPLYTMRLASDSGVQHRVLLQLKLEGLKAVGAGCCAGVSGGAGWTGARE